MDISEAKRLKELESENAKLKRLLVDAELDILMLKDLLSKKSKACFKEAGSQSIARNIFDIGKMSTTTGWA